MADKQAASTPDQTPQEPKKEAHVADIPMSLQDFANHHRDPGEIEMMAGFVAYCLRHGILHGTETSFVAKYEEFKKMPV